MTNSSTNLLIIFFFSILFCHCVVLEASHQVYSILQNSEPTEVDKTQPYRTGYHFQPLKNWINDPNAPMVYNGMYHFFYQYNPKGVVWGNIVWAHSTSRDLVNWTPHPHALVPSEPNSDINGCWSGAATILPGNIPVILYTGVDHNLSQVQNLAFPENISDPYLVRWSKSTQNPLMYPTRKNKVNATAFRDPSTAWMGRDGRWRVAVGSKKHTRGVVVMYTSADFVRWRKSTRPLRSKRGTGMWECPDFFPVSRTGSEGVDVSEVGDGFKHVLKVSLDVTRHDVYTVGRYDVVGDRYVPDEGSVETDEGLRFDYGKFYASKSFYDGEKRRRVLWGWVNESSTVAEDVKKGWSGIQAVPRTIVLDKNERQLVQWPIKEIERLRENEVTVPSKELQGGSVLQVSGVTASQADVEITFEVSELGKAEEMDPSWTNAHVLCTHKGASVRGGVGPFGLLVLASDGLKEQTAVFFRIFKAPTKYVVLMCSDQSRSSFNVKNDLASYGTFVDVDPVKEKLSLRSLIDHSVVESFGALGKNCITARVYPTLATFGDAHLYAFNNGTTNVNITSFTAWTMKTAQIA